ncbi:MAG: sulfurtransferase, partial [Idiomarinaceae bacterium]|nr:sulfurtransferase [Idiomarinaceae bacterium]
AESLERMGFDKVYSVTGGMSAWAEEKRPVVAGEG